MNRRDFLKNTIVAAGLSSINPALSSEGKQQPKHTYEAFSIAPNAFMSFKRIEPGTFLMGSQDKKRQEEDGPPHRVTITKPFYMGVYEVTQQQWNQVMKKLTWNNPSKFGGKLSHPVENVSWQQVHEFLDRVNQYNGKPLFRLPTEAQWEYACRAGTTTRTYWGDDPNHEGAPWHAWLGGYPYGTTGPVGQLTPNAWGLYDMCGNVVEFTQDRFALYKLQDQTDPLNTDGKLVVARGGDWFHAHGVDSETRRKYGDDGGLSFVGFRVVRDVE